MKELTASITKLMRDFAVESSKALDGNKAAGTRARKITLELTAVMKQYRKESVAA